MANSKLRKIRKYYEINPNFDNLGIEIGKEKSHKSKHTINVTKYNGRLRIQHEGRRAFYERKGTVSQLFFIITAEVDLSYDSGSGPGINLY